MEKEILRIKIDVTGYYEVRGFTGTARMILFCGEAESDYFTGKVLPGGVDTQKEVVTGSGLSARYMLEGMDHLGKPCHLFVENNGAFPEDGGMIQTTPMILTDSSNLKFLEETTLRGVVDNEDGNLLIRIFANMVEENLC